MATIRVSGPGNMASRQHRHFNEGGVFIKRFCRL
jgi:hypothetical protein